MPRSILVIALAAGLASCGRHAPPGQRVSPSGVLTQQEIATAHADNAYDAVQRLRPMFLRPRASGMTSPLLAVVFIDGIRRGAPEILRTVASTVVAEIRFLTAAEATTQYGLDLEGGVIDVKLVTR